MEMLKILHKYYDYNEPIFISNIKKIKDLSNFNDSTIRFYFHKLCKENLISKFDNGIFYFPKETILGKSTIVPEEVIRQRFISNKNNIFGYYSGIKFENIIGVTTQNPFVLEIFSNKASGIKRKYHIGYIDVIVRKPYIEINDKNYKLLQLLNFIGGIHINKLLTISQYIKNYIKQNKLSLSSINSEIDKIPSHIFKNLVISKLIYDFA